MDDHFTPLSDPRFQNLTIFASSVIALFGTVLFFLKNHPACSKIWTAYKPWLIMAPLCAISIGIGGFATIALFLLFSLLAIREFSQAAGLKDRLFIFFLYGAACAVYLAAGLCSKLVFSSLPIILLAAFLIIPPLRGDYSNMMQKVGCSFIAMIYLVWFPAHLALLAHHPLGYIYLLFFLIGTELNDVFAYITGKCFGRTPLAPKISPKKTIEGSIGAFIAVSIYVWFASIWVPGFTITLKLLAILLFTVIGTIGDLVMSAFKRELQVKDMGDLIPGHGGLLDRIDSLLLIAPFYYYSVVYL